MKKKGRRERDSLGFLSVPGDAYFGIQSLRASRNFPVSGIRLPAVMVKAAAFIKSAAAEANLSEGRLEKAKAEAIIQACGEIAAGRFADQFIVDVFQMGAGTSFHMNCNEVIANRAEEILGGGRGEYRLVHPNDHVNMGQSTNDVFPTAMRLAAVDHLQNVFFPSIRKIEADFFEKAEEFDPILKSGRTHLQDAAPVRLGQEFNAYGQALRKGRFFLEKAEVSLHELGIGGSAVGTGLNTSSGYRSLVVKNLCRLTGFRLSAAEDLREAMQSLRPMTEVSAALRNLAVETGRIANDLRLLASGPRTGFSEIELPAVAPGSSIMPGKINPSMLEMMNMVCYQVIGCDQVVCSAAQAGQLELNVMMPVVAYNLLFMIEIFGRALGQLDKKCIRGIKPNIDRCREYATKSLGMATALSAYMGYAGASEIAKESLRSGKPLVDLIREKKLFTEKQIEEILNPMKMTEPGIPGLKKKKRRLRKPTR